MHRPRHAESVLDLGHLALTNGIMQNFNRGSSPETCEVDAVSNGLMTVVAVGGLDKLHMTLTR